MAQAKRDYSFFDKKLGKLAGLLVNAHPQDLSAIIALCKAEKRRVAFESDVLESFDGELNLIAPKASKDESED